MDIIGYKLISEIKEEPLDDTQCENTIEDINPDLYVPDAGENVYLSRSELCVYENSDSDQQDRKSFDLCRRIKDHPVLSPPRIDDSSIEENCSKLELPTGTTSAESSDSSKN